MKNKYSICSKCNLAMSFVVFSLLVTMSCKRMDDTYRQFVEEGETIYVGKADSLLFKGGNERGQLSWLLLSDPKVSKYRVFWNNRNDSISGDLVKTGEVDTVTVLLNPLDEGKYEFEVYLFDDNNNSSVSNSVLGSVYGKRYINSLISRAYSNLRRINGGKDIEIEWAQSEEKAMFSLIEYKDVNDIEKTIIIDNESEKDTLLDVPRDEKFNLKTAFTPDSLAIDTFFSQAHVSPIIPLDPIEIDKNLWKDADLEDDFNFPEYDYWPIENLWTEEPGKNSIFFTDPNVQDISLPSWVTIDLGGYYTLNQLKVNQISHADSWIFRKCSPRVFEVWASKEATTNWSKWDLLLEGESIKPSGLPEGQLSSEDRAVNAEGEDYDFIMTGESYRYVRFKTIETWGGDLNMCLRELTLWGNEDF